MSFQNNSPQGAGGQNMETFSLLFSPPSKSADPQQQQASPLARSTSKTPGSAAGKNAFATREYTPSSRRRSATPASSVGRETPPPPFVSLFDTMGLPGDHRDAGKTPASIDEAIDMTTSPVAGVLEAVPQQPSVRQQSASHLALVRQPNVQDYDSCWVTIYGFHQNDLPLVLKEFSKCGDIVEFGSFDDGPYVNWTHVCYESKYAAQRALLRSGQQLSPTCMVGVKEMDEKKRDAIEQGSSLEDRRPRVPVIPPVLPTLDIDKKKAIAADPVVPLSSTSMWDKVCEFVLGI